MINATIAHVNETGINIADQNDWEDKTQAMKFWAIYREILKEGECLASTSADRVHKRGRINQLTLESHLSDSLILTKMCLRFREDD
ncbi:MAG: hypothetical protein KAH18_09780 [Psychromonas sp.]|nr:hypothetical protein [Psychromonas sp.]